jgi:hypothetical protein
MGYLMNDTATPLQSSTNWWQIVPGPTSGLAQTLAVQRASRARLIGTVRALRASVSDSVTLGPVDLPVAPLSIPDRITKRDYNYFNALNAALQDLGRRRGRTAEVHGPDLT